MVDLIPERQREFATDVVRRLREAGYQALWAGGCVRDQLLGLAPKDFDVATDATPQQIRAVFRDRKTLMIGAAFGVAAVVGPGGAGTVEVATFRQDASYSDGRHPDYVQFSTPEEDAKRRDFTINGLFMDPLAGQVIDYVGGQEDLNRKLIRAIGDPRARLQEDRLRMLRAVRIAARFACEIDPRTLAAIQELAPTVVSVSAERIGQEMRQLLTGPGRGRGLDLLAAGGLLDVLLPESRHLIGVCGIASSGAPRNAWTSAQAALDRLREPTTSSALAVLLIDYPSDAADLIAALAHRWRLSNDERDRALWLVERRDALVDAANQPWSRLQPVLISPGITELIDLTTARDAAADVSTKDVEYCRDRLALPAESLNPPPLITGRDLAMLRIPRGPVYAAILNHVRVAQLDGALQTHAQAIEQAQQLSAEWGAGGEAE